MYKRLRAAEDRPETCCIALEIMDEKKILTQSSLAAKGLEVLENSSAGSNVDVQDIPDGDGTICVIVV